uniref:Uncharacterized protein n=1 Tax=Panagrolaimus superbus TaxID=310955 RepID=A0A914YK34_9BILA
MSGCAALSAIAGSSSLGNENALLPPNRLGLRSHEFRRTICLGMIYGFNDSNNERASIRSSDDARSTASPGLLDESGLGLSPNNLDERSRLIAKIEKVREKITRLSITHEGKLFLFLF